MACDVMKKIPTTNALTTLAMEIVVTVGFRDTIPLDVASANNEDRKTGFRPTESIKLPTAGENVISMSAAMAESIESIRVALVVPSA
jgi:hypothetical protein